MTLIYRRCAALDVHEKSISACARIRHARDRQCFGREGFHVPVGTIAGFGLEVANVRFVVLLLAPDVFLIELWDRTAGPFYRRATGASSRARRAR